MWGVLASNVWSAVWRHQGSSTFSRRSTWSCRQKIHRFQGRPTPDSWVAIILYCNNNNNNNVLYCTLTKANKTQNSDTILLCCTGWFQSRLYCRSSWITWFLRPPQFGLAHGDLTETAIECSACYKIRHSPFYADVGALILLDLSAALQYSQPFHFVRDLDVCH